MAVGWYILRGDHWVGPMPSDSIRALLVQESLSPTTRLRYGETAVSLAQAAQLLKLPAIAAWAESASKTIESTSVDPSPMGDGGVANSAGVAAVAEVAKSLPASPKPASRTTPLRPWLAIDWSSFGQWIEIDRERPFQVTQTGVMLAVVAVLLAATVAYQRWPRQPTEAPLRSVAELAAAIQGQSFPKEQFFAQFGEPMKAKDLGERLEFVLRCRDGLAAVQVSTLEFSEQNTIAVSNCTRRSSP